MPARAFKRGGSDQFVFLALDDSVKFLQKTVCADPEVGNVYIF